jgi:hypothetical protein
MNDPGDSGSSDSALGTRSGSRSGRSGRSGRSMIVRETTKVTGMATAAAIRGV